MRKGMTATVQKIGGEELQDERLVSGKGGPGRVAGSSGSDLSSFAIRLQLTWTTSLSHSFIALSRPI
jgi:hypothetical protein